MASARACIGYEEQKKLAQEGLDAIAACERALAMERESVIQYAPDHGVLVDLVKALGHKYRAAVRQLHPYRREFERFLAGQAWTMSRNELTWRAIALIEVTSEPPLRGDAVPLQPKLAQWPK